MSSTPIPIFLDTSAIREAGFPHPDFQKLLKYSKSNNVKLFVSYIAWEELRTQFLQSACSEALKLRQQFDTVQRYQPGSLILRGLRPPALDLWGEPEIRARSHAAMAEFACDNCITVISIGADHADRAWDRYFKNDLPFNSAEANREKRRKDIPDSWILEAAIDVKRDHSGLIAVCHDGNLAMALEKVLDIRVFRTVAGVVEHIENTVQSFKTVEFVKTLDSAYVPPKEEPIQVEVTLATVLTKAESQFRTVATKVIGLVSYLGSPTKDQLYALLEQSDIPIVVSKNVAEQLALDQIIVDTGHYYIPGNKEAGAQAVAAVEPEIIRLVMSDD